MLIARGQLCLFMDADGATRVSDLELLEKAVAGCQSQAFGARKVGGAQGWLLVGSAAAAAV
jgi:hypothetical protein